MICVIFSTALPSEKGSFLNLGSSSVEMARTLLSSMLDNLLDICEVSFWLKTLPIPKCDAVIRCSALAIGITFDAETYCSVESSLVIVSNGRKMVMISSMKGFFFRRYNQVISVLET